MPLAPASLIDSWYSKSSWTYKAFSYLFVNPLWQKKVPNGFSICPFFWSALFSIFVFRPLVFVVLLLRSTVKLLCLGKILTAYERLLVRLGMKEAPTGMNAVMSLVMVAVAAIPLTLIGAFVIDLIGIGAVSVAVLPATLLGTFIVCLRYFCKHQYDENRCQVEAYTRVVTVLCVATAFVLHPDFAITSFFANPWWAVSTLVSAVASGLWFAISWVGHGVWFSILWCLKAAAISVPMAIACVIPLIVFAYLYNRFNWTFLDLGFAPLTEEEMETNRRRMIVERRITTIAQYLWQCTPTEDCMGLSPNQFRLAARSAPVVIALAESDVYSDYVSKEETYDLIPTVLIHIRDHYTAVLAARERRSATCKRMTAALIKVLTPITWTFKQGRILVAYLWELVKANKSRSCPYRTFQD